MTKFNIITSLCQNGGIGYHGFIPWTNSNLYTNMFDLLTRGNGNNAVLMGATTYNNIWSYQYIPLLGRDKLIWSNNVLNDEHSPCQKIKYINNIKQIVLDNTYDEVWVIGGEMTYSQILKENMPIKDIYLNFVDKRYKCDTHFPLELLKNHEKINMIYKNIVNNTDQYMMKFERK